METSERRMMIADAKAQHYNSQLYSLQGRLTAIEQKQCQAVSLLPLGLAEKMHRGQEGN
jgi:hypothetical protein